MAPPRASSPGPRRAGRPCGCPTVSGVTGAVIIVCAAQHPAARRCTVATVVRPPVPRARLWLTRLFPLVARFEFLQPWHQYNAYYEFKKQFFLQKEGGDGAQVRVCPAAGHWGRGVFGCRENCFFCGPRRAPADSRAPQA